MTTRETDQNQADRMVHVRLPRDLHRRLRVLVAARDETIQEWLSQVIAREVDRSGISLEPNPEYA